LEAGLRSRFEVDAEGVGAEAAIAEVVERSLRSLSASTTPDWLVLAEKEIDPRKIARAVKTLLDVGIEPDDLEVDPFDPEEAEEIAQYLLLAIERFAGAGGENLIACRRATVAASAAEALMRLRRILADRPESVDHSWLAEIASEVEKKELERIADWADGEFGKEEREVIDGATDSVSAAASEIVAELESLAGLDPDGYNAARRVLAKLVGETRSTLRSRGVVSYDDLLRRTHRLLEDSADICLLVRTGIDQLLVDEFQDTDRLQCRIVEQLALIEGRGDRPGLFVVGDPKQSIYGFRRADLVAYDEFKERVQSADGDLLTLHRNFRSVQPVLDEVERVVQPVMVEEWGLQPPFEPLVADCDTGDGEGPSVEHWVQWIKTGQDAPKPATNKKEDALELEAEFLAQDLRRLHDAEHVKWCDAVVLLRATTRQEVVLDALRRWGVPYEVRREREYFRQPEVVEVAALVRCVLEPSDTLALLTVLRSENVGVPDNALAPLWDSGFARAMADVNGREGDSLRRAVETIRVAAAAVRTGGESTLPLWSDALVNAIEVIAELREEFASDPPDRWIERLRMLWLCEVAAASRYLGRFRVARLERFFEQLERSLVESGPSRAEIARVLRKAVEEGRESQLPPEPDTEVDAVHVMTIHSAKGLGFDHVYLVQTQRNKPAASRYRLTAFLRGEDGREASLLGFPTPGFAAALKLKKRREQAEAVRLLYVAMTRAKKRLVISGGWLRPGKLVPAVNAQNLGQLIDHRAGRERLRRMATEQKAVEDEKETSVRWVFPALLNDAKLEVDQDRLLVDDVLLEQRITRDREALSVARAEAAARSRRQISSHASGDSHRSPVFDDGEEESALPGASEQTHDTLMKAGSVVHEILENLDLEKNLVEQIADQRTKRTESEPDEPVRERVNLILEKIEAGECLTRLAELAPIVLARELPVLVPPTEQDDALGFISGAIDLVYRDPDDGRLVIADYKTDQVDAESGIEERVEAYTRQLNVYASALQQAFDLDESPHQELWFLHADRVVRLEG
jgi:ATP-dependent helicase/nuclease subunit A